MRILKLIGLSISALLLIELSSYFLIGRDRINRAIIQNNETFLNSFPDSLTQRKSLYTNLNLSEKEKDEWRNIFKDDNLEFNIYHKSRINELNPTMDHFNYTIFTINEFIVLEVEEYENEFEYLAGWHSIYVWVFIDWIKIEKVNTGIS